MEDLAKVQACFCTDVRNEIRFMCLSKISRNGFTGLLQKDTAEDPKKVRVEFLHQIAEQLIGITE